MELRPYQTQLIKDLYAKLKVKAKCLLIAATGSGKTAMFSNIVKDARRMGRNCFIVIHREELALQSLESLRQWGVTEPIGIIKAGHTPIPEANIQIASVQTMTARKILPPSGAVVIIDEAHTSAFFNIIKDWIPTYDGFVVGVTATPRRSKKSEGLGSMFSDYVCAPSPSELIEMGFLAPARFFGFADTFDVKKVKTRAGDFAQDELARACNNEESNKTVIREIKKHIGERTGIVFAVDVAHAMALSEGLNSNGISTSVVTGETTRAERQKIYDELSRGKIKLISSVGVLTEGFDIKSISCVVMARPTKSWALNCQMAGRSLRTYFLPNKLYEEYLRRRINAV